MNATCPTPTALDQPCNSNRSYCVDGACTGSYCIALGLVGCECTARNLKCSVCCYLGNGTDCTSTSVLANVSQYELVMFDNCVVAMVMLLQPATT